MASPARRQSAVEAGGDCGATGKRPGDDEGIERQERAHAHALLPLPRCHTTTADVHVAGEARTEARHGDALVLEQQRQLQIVKAKTMFEVWLLLSVCPAAGESLISLSHRW